MSFFNKLLLFHIPLVLLFAGAMFVAVYSGEAMPPRLVYETQLQYPDTIYRTMHRQQDFLYKYFSFDYVKPEVLFLGASRLTTFRAAFLNRNPSAAYNAALPGMGMPYTEAFIDNFTPQTAPKVLLLQVDQFWFNEDWYSPRYTALPIEIKELELDKMMMNTRYTIRQLLNGTMSINQLLRRRHRSDEHLALGIDAMRIGDGFAADGGVQIISKLYTPEAEALNLNNALQEMRQGISHYLRGDSVNEEALAQLERMIDKAAALDIQVIGFAPGFMPTLYNEMMEAGQHTYIEKAMPRVASLFEARGFYFFDFTDISDFSHDNEMRDGDHPHEIASLRMYMKMVEGAPELLGPYSDLEALQTMIDHAPNPSAVVPRETLPAAGR